MSFSSSLHSCFLAIFFSVFFPSALHARSNPAFRGQPPRTSAVPAHAPDLTGNVLLGMIARAGTSSGEAKAIVHPRSCPEIRTIPSEQPRTYETVPVLIAILALFFVPVWRKAMPLLG